MVKLNYSIFPNSSKYLRLTNMQKMHIGLGNRNYMAKENKNEIVIYKDQDGPAVIVNFEKETAWLSTSQMAQLFQKDDNTIATHIRHVYAEKELDREKTSLKKANTRNTSIGSNKPTIYYNLDVIISVGYRVKSQNGTRFRIWATTRLRDYLLKGYAINKDRLSENKDAKVKELQSAVKLIQNAIQNNKLEGYEKEVLNIITDYASTWTMLYQYDEQKILPETETKKTVSVLDYDKVTKSIERFRARLIKDKQASDLFGKEQGEKLKALLGNVEQTFAKKQLYKSFEEKAAHLLYFAIKDHPFADGNKRIGALMFMLYLIENNRVYNKKGERIINDNALTAIALLIAESKPDQKEVMTKLVASLIAKK